MRKELRKLWKYLQCFMIVVSLYVVYALYVGVALKHLELYRKPKTYNLRNIVAMTNQTIHTSFFKQCLMLTDMDRLKMIDQSTRKTTSTGKRISFICESKRVKKILVVAYQRSGSTFTSEILQHGGNRTFFSMEPLWQIYRTCYRRSEGICCPNNKCRSPVHPNEEIHQTLSVFRSIYSCNFTALPYDILKSFATFPSTEHENLKRLRCFNLKTAELEQRVSLYYDNCVQRLKRACESSSVIIIKTLRINIDLALELKASLDNLYIVHLFRDPRAIFFSRTKVGALTNDPINVQAKALCSVLYKNNMDALHRSDKVYNLLYERIAKEPHGVVRSLFKFCELDFSMTTSEWLQSFTNGSMQLPRHKLLSEKYGAFSAYSKESFEVSRKWRKKISLKTNKIIQDSCKEVLDIFGLRVFEEERELRNFGIQVLKG